jgi:hypothetical protein
MIVVSEPGGLVCITQPDHAYFSGQLAALWRADALPDHPHRDEIVFAAREHDNGWRETDAAPRVDREPGRPHDFLTLPWEARREVWRRGVARFAAERPRSALLIAEHAAWLHRERRGEPEVDALLAELDELRGELWEAADTDAEQIAADYRFVYFTDFVSLAASSRWSDPVDRSYRDAALRVRWSGDGEGGGGGSGTIRLDPFPLAGATTFRIPCRRIPERRYSGDADLAVELASARWEEQTVRVVPG